MKSKKLKEIRQMDGHSLTAVIDYWKEYDPKTVLLTYAELKRRNFNIADNLKKKQSAFCEKNNHTDINIFLDSYLKEIGFNSYDEYFKSESVEQEIETAKIKKQAFVKVDREKIINAGRALKSLVYVILFTILAIIIAGIISINSRSMDNIRNIYIIIAVISLISNIIILFNIYTAGDNIEKSVAENNA